MCTCLFVSSHPYILISSDSCALACILASSYAQVGVCLLVTLYPHILLSLGSCILCACWYLSILAYSYSQFHVLRVLAGILESSNPHILRFMYSRCLLMSSHPHILICSCYFNLKLLPYYKGALISLNTSSGNKNFCRQSGSNLFKLEKFYYAISLLQPCDSALIYCWSVFCFAVIR